MQLHCHVLLSGNSLLQHRTTSSFNGLFENVSQTLWKFQQSCLSVQIWKWSTGRGGKHSGLIYSISRSFSFEFESPGGVSSCLPWKACFCCSANMFLFDIAYPTVERMKIFSFSNLIQQMYKRDLVFGSKANLSGLWSQCQTMGWCGQLNWAGEKHHGRRAKEEECVSVAVTSLMLISCTLDLMQPYQFQLLLLLMWTLHLVPISFLQSVIKRW